MAARPAKAIVEPPVPALGEKVRELDARVTRLEARLRVALPLVRKGLPVASGRPRPRCPGCTLELPKGRRRDVCVWCGFCFDAVGPLQPRSPRPRKRTKRL